MYLTPPSSNLPDRVVGQFEFFCQSSRVSGDISLGSTGGPTETIYFATEKKEIVAYNVASGSVTLRAALPETTPSFIIRDTTLYSAGATSVFALDLSPSASAPRLRWRYNLRSCQSPLAGFRSPNGEKQ